nr:uncharacterized protein CI109_007529 [Kwoniella shandongensis]KAA5524176.1 hypothetical protein CI109_007529 [Kwoniella shandongensis]
MSQPMPSIDTVLSANSSTDSTPNPKDYPRYAKQRTFYLFGDRGPVFQWRKEKSGSSIREGQVFSYPGGDASEPSVGRHVASVNHERRDGKGSVFKITFPPAVNNTRGPKTTIGGLTFEVSTASEHQLDS